MCLIFSFSVVVLSLEPLLYYYSVHLLILFIRAYHTADTPGGINFGESHPPLTSYLCSHSGTVPPSHEQSFVLQPSLLGLHTKPTWFLFWMRNFGLWNCCLFALADCKERTWTVMGISNFGSQMLVMLVFVAVSVFHRLNSRCHHWVTILFTSLHLLQYGRRWTTAPLIQLITCKESLLRTTTHLRRRGRPFLTPTCYFPTFTEYFTLSLLQIPVGRNLVSGRSLNNFLEVPVAPVSTPHLYQDFCKA